jgi:peptidoglycan/LPS O-acetylase OafA/YrhL
MTAIATPAARAGQLDALRAFAVLAVIFSHTITESYQIGEFAFFEFGAYGVYLFFVLSGFLITGQLLEAKQARDALQDSLGPPLKAFFAKRALRLLPAYYLALCGAWFIDLRTIRVEFPWHAMQLTNVYFGLDQTAENISPVGHLWSLSMEWQFYLIWPFVVLLFPPRALVAITIGLIAFSFTSWLKVLPLPQPIVLTSIPASLDSLGFGAMLAIAISRGWPVERIGRFLWWTGLACLLMTLPLMIGYPDIGWVLSPYAHEIMNLFFTLLVYRACHRIDGSIGKCLDNRNLQYTGVISYGIYLYHQYILSTYEGLAGRMGGWMPIDYGWKLTIALFALSWIVAHFSWQWLEQPINKLRRRFHYPPKTVSDMPVTAAAS